MNFDVPPTGDRKINNENLESVFTPELRRKLSVSFMEYLEKNKTPSEDEIKFRKIIGEPSKGYYEAEEGLSIFRKTIYDLIESPDFPNGQVKMTLKIYLENLNTLSLRRALRGLEEKSLSSHEMAQLNDPISSPISGLQSYGNTVKVILSTLQEVLTPEVNLAIHSYADKIFIKPFNQTLGNQE